MCAICKAIKSKQITNEEALAQVYRAPALNEETWEHLAKLEQDLKENQSYAPQN